MSASDNVQRPPSSLKESAYVTLEHMMVTLQIKPGTLVSEVELSKKLGISRTPIREALQRLTIEHLITVLPKRGILVAPIDVVRQIRLVEFRRQVERFIVHKAAVRASELERRILVELGERMKNEKNNEKLLRLDRELNDIISNAARNEFAKQALQTTFPLSRRLWYYLDSTMPSKAGDWRRSGELHSALSHAVASGDAQKAVESVDQLLDYIEEYTRNALSYIT